MVYSNRGTTSVKCSKFMILFFFGENGCQRNRVRYDTDTRSVYILKEKIDAIRMVDMI